MVAPTASQMKLGHSSQKQNETDVKDSVVLHAGQCELFSDCRAFSVVKNPETAQDAFNRKATGI